MTIKEIQAGYLTSSYFKDIYLHLAENILTSSKATIRQVETQAEKKYCMTYYCSVYKLIITKPHTMHT